MRGVGARDGLTPCDEEATKMRMIIGCVRCKARGEGAPQVGGATRCSSLVVPEEEKVPHRWYDPRLLNEEAYAYVLEAHFGIEALQLRAEAACFGLAGTKTRRGRQARLKSRLHTRVGRKIRQLRPHGVHRPALLSIRCAGWIGLPKRPLKPPPRAPNARTERLSSWYV